MTRGNTALKLLRVRSGLTQEEMARRLTISRQTYSKIENGSVDGNIAFWSTVQREFKISSEKMWSLVKNENRE